MKLSNSLLVLATLLVAVTLPSWVKGQNIWPDTPCTTDLDCNPPSTEHQPWLVCNQHSKCGCLTIQEHFHYGTVNRCLLSAQGRCNGQTTLPSDMTPNSQCDGANRKVICKAAYEETATKTCARSLDGPCTVPTDCDQDLFLTCDGAAGQCKCRAGSIFVDGRCQLEVNSECEVKDPLTPGPPTISCPGGSACTNGHCEVILRAILFGKRREQ